MTPNIKPRLAFKIAKEKRREKACKGHANKKAMAIQIDQLRIQIKRLTSEKNLSKKQIEELKRNLEELQKRYNQLDDESVNTSALYSRY
ncbi:MAG: hypothetical protein WCX82_00305 [archaeon]|jgi:ABC-type phosphate transport system auxiliary subunit